MCRPPALSAPDAGPAPGGDLAGRTFLVTGATSGIGRAGAAALTARGAHVVLACRSPARARELAAELVAGPGAGTASHVPLDLADLDSVRACAEAVVARGDPVHVLVNNAGVAGVRGATAQGFELTFGVTHLGHFLLTRLLLAHRAALGLDRVVTVASKAHHGARGVDFAALARPTRSRTGLVEYQVAKLCNVLFTRELAARTAGEGLVAYAVHPGVVATGIWRPLPAPLRWIATRFMASTEEGAREPVRCATAPAAAVGPSGSYLEDGEVRAPSPVATPELAAELWRRSEEWTGRSG